MVETGKDQDFHRGDAVDQGVGRGHDEMSDFSSGSGLTPKDVLHDPAEEIKSGIGAHQ